MSIRISAKFPKRILKPLSSAAGPPEAEDGVSSVRQEVFRPEAAHQAGARGPQGELQRWEDIIQVIYVIISFSSVSI